MIWVFFFAVYLPFLSSYGKWDELSIPDSNIKFHLRNKFRKMQSLEKHWDFPGGTVVKNLPTDAGDKGSSPGPGRSHVLQSS